MPAADDTLVFHRMPADSDTAVIAFSSRAAKNGTFNFFSVQEHVPTLTALLVRDPALNWYNAGLPGVGATVEEIAARIQREVAALGAKRTLAIGSSMGGYAAILFGCLIGSERVVALAPQTLLSPVFRLSPAADVALQAPDLRPFVRNAPGTEVDLIAGWDDMMDVFHAQRVAELPSVRVLALRERQHSFVHQFSEAGELWPFLTELIEGRTPEICEVDPECTAGDRDRIAEAVVSLSGGEWEAGRAAIAPVAEASPGWAGPNLALSLALVQLGDFSAAERALANTIQARPGWDLPRRLLAQCLLQLGREAEGRAEWHRALALNPKLAPEPKPFDSHSTAAEPAAR